MSSCDPSARAARRHRDDADSPSPSRSTHRHNSQFAKAHCRVIMVNRREDQGERSIAQFKEDTGGEADVEWVGCDLGNLKQAKEVFTKIAEKEDRIDLVSLSAERRASNRKAAAV